MRPGSESRLKANQSCIDLKSRVSRRQLVEEPCNVDEDEADELAEDENSQVNSNKLDKTGNFNDLMNQIIQQYDQVEAEKEEDNFYDKITLEFSKISEIK